MTILGKLRKGIPAYLENCRLCWRVALVVLASIVLIEAIILIPSYRNYERDLLRRLEREGLATVKTLFLAHPNATEVDLRRMTGDIVRESTVQGLAIHGKDGALVTAVGILPSLPDNLHGKSGFDGRWTDDGTGYLVRWSEQALGAPFVVTARLDSAWIGGELQAFVIRIIGLVLLISTFVTMATMAILSHSVLMPVLRLRRNLMATANDPEHPDLYTIDVDRKDELGDVMVAFNRMIHDVASTYRREIQRVVAMSENSIAAVVAYDGQGALIYCNKALLALCGAPDMDTLRGSGFPRVIANGQSPVPLAEYLGRRAVTEEIVLEMAPAKPVPCLIGANHLRDENGHLALGYASILEVSEMHAYRERLELKNMELAAANRAKSEFLAHMSHELRTPLNAILGFSEMMLRETLGPLGTPRYREYVRDIHDSGAHLTSIISDILDLSKMEAGKTELSERSIDVSETVNACLRLVRARARQSKIELDTEWHQALPTLRADPRLVKQIILNLLSNAIKFTPENGRVTVWAGVTAEGELALAVRDTGTGIAKQDIPTALAPFGQVGASRTKKHDGTGLGLPLVKSFVELHRGALDIQSRLGVGTTVTVRFPKDRVSDSVTAVSPESAAPSAA